MFNFIKNVVGQEVHRFSKNRRTFVLCSNKTIKTSNERFKRKISASVFWHFIH